MNVRDLRFCTGTMLVVAGCTSNEPLESKYPDDAVKNAPSIRLNAGDIPLTSRYHNAGIVAGQSYKDEATAERTLRLEAAKRGANAVYRYSCDKHYDVGVLRTVYACKGKAVVLPADA